MSDKPRLAQLEAGADDDVAQTIAGVPTWAPLSLPASYTDEQVRDVIGAALVAGTGMTVTVNDAGDTITLASSAGYTDEQVRDVIGAALVAGTGITVTVNDAGDTITITSSVSAYTDEQVRDVIGAALVAGTGVTITVNDGADTITIDATAALHVSASVNTATGGEPGMTLGATPYEESFQLFKNGVLLTPGVAYTRSGTAVTFTAALTAGQVIVDTYFTTTASPSDSTLTAPTAVVSDSFDRGDSSTSLGSADVGGAWTAFAGTWGISSNKAYHVSTFADGFASIDSGLGDCTIYLTLSTVGAGGILFREQDTTHYWFVEATATDCKVYRSDGFGGNLISNLGASFANGDIMKVVLAGSSIKVYKNGSQIGSTITDSTYASATKHGLRDYTGSARYNDFSVWA